MKGFKRGIAAAAAATLCLTSIPLSGIQVRAAGIDKTVKLNPGLASVFHDTDGDGLGEFEGWGTSLCWWANRIGYSDKLTAEAARVFYSDDGLDMNIGRYNVGGGDLVGEPEKVPVNKNAGIYDLETEGRTPSYAGTSMKVENNTAMGNVSYAFSDADFGITKGTKVEDFKKIGWINKLGDTPGQGDNLRYTVDAEEAGSYTVKLLLTLTGENKRDVAIRVNDNPDSDRVIDKGTINGRMIASGNNNMLFVAEFSDVELKAGENTINIAGKNDWTLDFVKMAVIKSGQEGKVPEGQEFLHKEHITRSDSAVPGYAVDVTKIDTSKKSIEDYQKDFARVDEECGYAWNYDWDADKNQMNILKAAAEASGEDFIAEAFSNSPPYFMTVSGCSSGAADSSKDNLRADSYHAFAAYMADVIEHWNEEGVISFQSATPMNEPYTNYWGANSNKQEGCHFDQGESQSKIITALKKELDSKGISIILSGTDETSIDTAISSYNKLSQEARDAITRIDTHTYGGSKRAELKELAEQSGENLWMSEVDGSYTAGSNAGEMSPALGLAKQMMKDVNGLKSSAWIFWNAIDMHVDQKVTTRSDADYGSLEEIYKNNNDMKNAYWGLAIGDHDNQEIVLTKKYYAYGQFSRYIRPGYAIIASSDDTLAAYDPKGKKAVIVAANTAGEDKTWQFDLSKFNTMGDKITAIRTSGTLKDGENWADVSGEGTITADTAKKNVTATLKANSITTYTIEGVEYDSSEEEIVSIRDVTAYTVEGVPAVLPGKVEVTTNKNNTSEEKVTWDLENADLTVNGEIKGTVKGTDIEAIAKVKVVEPNTAYFIDCNSPKSPKYAAVDAYAELLNETADQKYTEGSWGYVDDYGKYDGNVNDEYDTGWYAKSGQSITYKIPLEAGRYQVILGFKEWWTNGNSSRKMTVTAVQDGKETKLGTSNTWDGNNWWNRDFYDLTCEKAGEVTFDLAKVSGQPDPALSFIEIRKVLDITALKEAMAEAASVDRSKYSKAKIAKLDQAMEAGRKLLLSASATQEQMDDAEKAIRNEITALGEGFTEEQIAENDYVLYLVNCGTSDASVVPEGYRRGLYQSNVDQEYAEDAETGLSWGYEPNDEHSRIVNGGSGAKDITGSYIYMADSGITFDKDASGFKYRFELPKRANQDYTVTIGVKNPWDTRNVDIKLEGETVQSDLKLTKGQLVEETYEAEVKDGELNVMVHSPTRTNQYGDPVLSYVIVRAVAAYTTDRLAAKIAECREAMEGSSYSQASTEKFNQAAETAQALIDAGSKDQKAIKEALKGLQDAFDGLKVVYNYTSITGTDGARLFDNNGNKIQAHGGQIQQFTVDGVTKYYWYGEDKTNGYRPVTGVHLYTSTDLYNWTDEGVALKCIPVSEKDYGKDQEEGYQADLSIFETDEYFRDLYGSYKDKKADDTKNYSSKLEEVYWNLAEDRTVMERPKVLYNDATGKYVMWFHADGRTPTSTADYGKARAGVAISDNPAGPFRLLGTYLLHDSKDADHSWDGEGGHLRDMNLFKDDDGQGYVIYSSDGNLTTYIAKLNAEYTGLIAEPAQAVEGTGKEAEEVQASDYTRNFIGASREAPAMFKYKGKYYIINSGCTGWNPNKAQYAVADHPLGPWTVMGDPCVDDNRGTTFDTQSTCVFPVDAENGKFIYMGDRWFNPDSGGDLSDSRYVWLPVEFLPDHRLQLKSYANWTLDELDNKASFEVVSELPSVVNSASEITEELLPSKVTINYGGDSENVEKDVKWTIGKLDAAKLGVVEVKGTLTDGAREFTHQIAIVNPKTIYFFDSGAEQSSYYDTASGILGRKLKNKTPDGKYTEGTGAGYLGVTELEKNEGFDLGHYAGDSYLANGWWAAGGKNIEYAFDLEPGTYTVSAGFQEWWNTSRPSKMTVKSGDQKLAEKSFTIQNTSKDLQVDQTFEVTEATAGKIVVSISKTGNPDPVISWIGLVDENASTLPPADISALADKIDEVRNIATEGYTSESVEAFRAAMEPALKEAEDVLNNGSAVQEEVDSATQKLHAAFESAKAGLVTIESVKAALTQGIEAVQQGVKEESIYTAESWAAYMEALQNAQDVLEDAGITQAEADAALANLETAAKALVEKQSLVDKSRLQTWIAKMEDTLNSGQSFTVESRKAAEEALANAKTVNEKADASVAEVDEAWRGLMNAFLGLEDGVVNTGLAQAIKTVQELLANPETEKNYTADSVQNVKDKLQAAELVYADSTATQEMVNNATNELIDAVTHLLEKDFSYLIAAIGQAKELLANEERYTASTAGKLKEAVAAAEQLAANKDGDTAEIDSAYEKILSAIAGLELRGNKAELESVLNKAKAILENSDQYLASTLEGLQDAYEQAKAVYDNADAVQSEVTEATVKLLGECMEARILGDVDMNGIVDRADSALMLRYSAELTELTEEQALAGDVNGDGRTDTADASRVLEFAAGKIEAF